MDDLRHITNPMMRWQYGKAKKRIDQSREVSSWNWILIVMIVLCLIFWAGVIVSFAEPVIDLDVIAQIESSGCLELVGRDGLSYGCHQITKPVVQEWNQYHPRDRHEHMDMMDEAVSRKVADWYLHKRIPQMLRHFGLPVTVENQLIAYNAGIGNAVKGRVPPITKMYIDKYHRFSRAK